MVISELQSEWHIAEAMDVFQFTDANAVQKTIQPGQLGYICRNGHDTKIMQIVFKVDGKDMWGVYVTEAVAEQCFVVLRPAPPASTPQLYWHNFWEWRFKAN
jgi:hypothetical protein